MKGSAFIFLGIIYHLAIVLSAADVECPSEGVAFLPHDDCTKYYLCANGDPVEMTCPEGTYFNPEIDECDFEVNVPECQGGTRPPVDSSTATTPRSTTTSRPSSSTTERPSSTTTTRTTTTPTTTERPEIILRECGDTIFASSGVIEYQLNRNYTSEELCSFIVRIENFTSIVFTLEEHGINENEFEPISIFGFTKEQGVHDTVHLGPPNPVTQAYVSGSLAIVVFSTGSNIGTGFRLSFQGVNAQSYSTNGYDEVFSSGKGSLRLPTQQPSDAEGTFNAFVFNQYHHVITPSYFRMSMQLSKADFYICGDVMKCDCDYLEIFTFQSGTLESNGRFCDQRYHQAYFETKGMFIAIFNVFYDPFLRSVTLDWSVDME